MQKRKSTRKNLAFAVDNNFTVNAQVEQPLWPTPFHLFFTLQVYTYNPSGKKMFFFTIPPLFFSPFFFFYCFRLFV